MINKIDTTLNIRPRWYSIAGGLLTSTICGMLLYAFGVFIKPISTQLGWSTSEIARTFSICLFCNGFTAFFAGRLSDRFGPRYVVLLGGLLTSLGFFLSSFIHKPFQFYITYGVMSGIGSGLIYLPPIVTVPKWWPDRPALATGLVVSGLGLGAFFMSPIATYIILNYDWRFVFSYCGIGMGVMTIFAAYFLSNPPDNWKLSETKVKNIKNKKNISKSVSYSQAVKSYQFWLLYLSYFFGAMAGLMVISHIAAHGEDLGLISMKANLSVSALAICNCLTRILSGVIVDKIRLKTYFVFLLILQTIAMLILYPSGNNYLCLMIVAAVIGWNFGAMFTLFPIIVLEFYGPKKQGSIYGLLFTSYGVAGLLGPWFGGYLRDIFGDYFISFLINSCIVVIAAFIIWSLKPPFDNYRSDG